MKIEFKESFLKSVDKLRDTKLKEEILNVIEDVETVKILTEIRNIKKLKGYNSYYRIRVGNYRIGVKWIEEEKSLYFVTFGHRKDIYNIFP